MESGRGFRFKKFTVNHDRSTMRVGTDGVLLGSWCGIDDRMTRALDIGTGSGLIALMLAQRSNDLIIEGIDIDRDSCSQASENVEKSPWRDRIKINHIKLQDLVVKYTSFDKCEDVRKYDLVVSNPPYFNNSLLPLKNNRIKARHTLELSHEELVNSVKFLLSDIGKFAVIIPNDNVDMFCEICFKNNLFLLRRTDVRTTQNSLPKRALLEYVSYDQKTCSMEELVIENSPRDFTSEYKKLTRDFYLNF